MKRVAGIRRLLLAGVTIAWIQPATALAQAATDARFESYPKLSESSPMVTWAVFGAAVAACAGALFFKMPKPKEKERD